MSNPITSVFFFLGLSLLIWSSASGLSTYLSKGFEREHLAAKEGSEKSVPLTLSADTQALREASLNQLDNLDAQFKAALALEKESYAKKDVNILMETISAYQRVLSVDPNHLESILSIARICLDQGIYDQAAIYYKRYLALKPEDLRARTDLSLSLMQSERAEEAINELNSIIKVDSSFFPAQFSLALAFHLAGKESELNEQIKILRTIAPDDQAKAAVDDFFKSVQEKQATLPQHTDIKQSPAAQVSTFFNKHPIVGPKLISITWPKANLARIELDNFPMEQMPPFAKDKFINSIKNAFSNLSLPIEILIYDKSSEKEQLTLSVGKSN